MVDTVSPDRRSQIMRAIKSPSGLERKVEPLLVKTYGAHITHQPVLPGLTRQPDFYDGPTNTAIWVNGCYWHGCGDHFIPPRTNTKYWTGKIAANRRRDLNAWSDALEKGYTVRVIWEHDVE